MTNTGSKLSVKTEQKASGQQVEKARSLQNLRRGLDHFLEDFELDFLRSSARRLIFDVEPLWPRRRGWSSAPAVDIVETDMVYEVTADLPGIEKKDIEIKIGNGKLSIKGEKKKDKEEENKDYRLRERLFGSFERSFQIPDSVDMDKIEAIFKKGELIVILPKKPDVQKPARKITVKSSKEF